MVYAGLLTLEFFFSSVNLRRFVVGYACFAVVGHVSGLFLLCFELIGWIVLGRKFY